MGSHAYTRRWFLCLMVALAMHAGADQDPPKTHEALRVSEDGHYFHYQGKDVVLVGDSGTQCVMQDLNLDYRAWIDDIAARGVNAAHVWAFVPARQREDRSVVEGRYGYVYPSAVPWARRADGPLAADQKTQWDLTVFDEGDDPSAQYWPRLRDLARHARDKGLCLGVTLFFGWPKHDSEERPDWQYHPFNVANGGHLEDKHGIVVIETPGTEVLEREWSDDWPAARKTQWVWERYADKMVTELLPLGNVFFVYKDERSYDGGAWQDNMTEHMVDFLHRRGAEVVVDWEAARGIVDAVMVDTGAVDKRPLALDTFLKNPPRPVMLLESTPYTLGDPAVRRSMWTFAMGGGHFIFHDDERQGTPTTGVMGYDPHVEGGVKPCLTYDWLGHLCRFLNEHIGPISQFRPCTEPVREGKAYCLAAPKGRYACYLPEGGRIALELPPEPASVTARWYDPRTGKFPSARMCQGPYDGVMRFEAPSDEDWALLVYSR